jgi:large exoprotein involved in heme utilization and adhesion
VIVRSGAQVLTSTNFGEGAAGAMTVNASESVDLIGYDPHTFEPSALSSETAAAGKGGDITINTGRLRVQMGQGYQQSLVGCPVLINLHQLQDKEEIDC